MYNQNAQRVKYAHTADETILFIDGDIIGQSMPRSTFQLLANNSIIQYKSSLLIKTEINTIGDCTVYSLTCTNTSRKLENITLYHGSTQLTITLYLPDLDSIWGAVPILNSVKTEVTVDTRLVDYICKCMILPNVTQDQIK